MNECYESVSLPIGLAYQTGRVNSIDFRKRAVPSLTVVSISLSLCLFLYQPVLVQSRCLVECSFLTRQNPSISVAVGVSIVRLVATERQRDKETERQRDRSSSGCTLRHHSPHSHWRNLRATCLHLQREDSDWLWDPFRGLSYRFLPQFCFPGHRILCHHHSRLGLLERIRINADSLHWTDCKPKYAIHKNVLLS